MEMKVNLSRPDITQAEIDAVVEVRRRIVELLVPNSCRSIIRRPRMLETTIQKETSRSVVGSRQTGSSDFSACGFR